MSLLDIANKLDESGFDPSKGKVANGRTELPEGEYLVSFDNITHNASGDNDFLMLTFKVLQGDHADETESIFPRLETITSKGNKMPDFVIAQSISEIKVVGAMCDIVVPNKVFAGNSTQAYEAIVPILRPGIGTMMKLKKTFTENKKNPDRPYSNYEFSKAKQPSMPKPEDITPTAEEDPFKDAKTGMEINSNDLPFDVSDMKETENK